MADVPGPATRSPRPPISLEELLEAVRELERRAVHNERAALALRSILGAVAVELGEGIITIPSSLVDAIPPRHVRISRGGSTLEIRVDSGPPGGDGPPTHPGTPGGPDGPETGDGGSAGDRDPAVPDDPLGPESASADPPQPVVVGDVSSLPISRPGDGRRG